MDSWISGPPPLTRGAFRRIVVLTSETGRMELIIVAALLFTPLYAIFK